MARKPEEPRGFNYYLAWVVFVGLTLVGAGLSLSQETSKQQLGFILLVSPLLVFGVLMALFYWKSRRIN